MKTTKAIGMAAALALGLVLPAAAGGYGKCSYDTQTCLNEMAASLKGRGWVGIEYDIDDKTGVTTIKRVVAGSPAEAGGLQKEDTLLALNGAKMGGLEKNEALSKEMKNWVPGRTVEYTVRRSDGEHKVKVTLAELPKEVMAQMLGMHMMEHAKVDVAEK